MRDLLSEFQGRRRAERPRHLVFIRRGKVDYTLCLNSGLSQPR
jgi:hypothetical protein